MASHEIIAAFTDTMRDAGIEPPSEIIQDGTLHRFSSADGRSKNSWYTFFDDPELPAGAYGCWKRQISETWCGKSTRKLSAEEKAAYARRVEESKRQREEAAAQVAAECRTWCKATWDRCGEAPESHPYLQRKQISPNGVRLLKTRDDHGALMVPVMDPTGVIHGIQFIAPDGVKKFKTGTAKTGNCFKIGAVVDDTIIITEGFATGGSIHAATGQCVLVAFDAGNLKALAITVRAKRPTTKIIIAADNDAWAKVTDEGGAVIEYRKVPCEVNGKKQVNTGIIKASEAAKAAKCLMIAPQFKNTDSYPTDFNDLAITEGLEEVSRQFAAIMHEEEPPAPEEEPPAEREPIAVPRKEVEPFTCLGYDHNVYYYLPQGSNQVIPLAAAQHGKGHLMTLAPLNFWEAQYPGKGGANYDQATNALMRFQEKKGVYDPSRLRGRGAWEDHNRSVLHLGNVMYVDGKAIEPHEISSRYIYEAAAAMEYDTPCSPLATPEAKRIIDLCDMITWERPIYGRLLAGWCVIAPICGALRWRPHIHLTGSGGSGKSWILSNIVAHLVGPAALQVMGSTTAAAIRQALGSDARPVIHDEFEGEGQTSMKRVQDELELARACSSDNEALTLKGGIDGHVKVYRPRAAFCFSSIGVNTQQYADVSRVTVLSLRKNYGTNEVARRAQFDKLTDAWAALMLREYQCSFRARNVRLIPVIRKNAETFARAGAAEIGTQRAGDQFGALLAGAYACFSVSEISLEGAREWIAGQDWSEYRVKENELDESRCLDKILQTCIKVQGDRGSVFDMSIGEAILIADGKVTHSVLNFETAHDTLKRNGIRILYDKDSDESVFAVSNTHSAIEKFMEKTPWQKNWGQLLSRLPRAKTTGATYFGPGYTARAVSIPVDLLAGE